MFQKFLTYFSIVQCGDISDFDYCYCNFSFDTENRKQLLNYITKIILSKIYKQ